MAYSVEADLNLAYGETNIQTYADLDRDDDAAKIAARIARAIAVGDAEIDDAARRGGYSTPIKDQDGDTPVTITNLSAVLAGLWLYEAVASMDTKRGEAAHKFTFRRSWARRMKAAIISGDIKLDAVSG